MPANLTPEYRKAEEQFRAAVTTEEKIHCLEQMLRVIPKHKGTDHLQADLKGRLAKLRRELGGGPRRARRVDPFHVERSGAGQITLLGLPNAGKSALVGALSNAHVTVADYPFSTRGPVPGMMRFEDAQIQLVDLPPVTAEHIEGGQIGAYRNSDMIWVVADLAGHSLLEDVQTLQELLASRLRIAVSGEKGAEGYDSENRLRRMGLLVGAKADLPRAAENFDALADLMRPWLPMHKVSAVRREGLDELAAACWRMLGKIRIYAKKPGKEPDMDEPFLVPEDATVGDLAAAIHKEIAQKLKHARIWGSSQFDGQQVHHDYPLADKDIVELHY